MPVRAVKIIHNAMHCPHCLLPMEAVEDYAAEAYHCFFCGKPVKPLSDTLIKRLAPRKALVKEWLKETTGIA